LEDAYEGIEDAAVYVKDLDGRYLMANAAGAAVLGLEPDQLVGKTDQEVFPEQAAMIREIDEAVVADGVSRTYEDATVDGDGETRVYLTTKAPLRDASGAVTGVIGISTDISSRKAAEEEVRRREATLAESQAVANVGSWDRDLVRGTLEWSEEMYRILGLDPEESEPVFESFLAAIHPDDREGFEAAVDEAMKTGTSFEVEYRFIRPDGEVRTLMARGRCFVDADGEPLRTVGAVVDITARRAAEELLRRREAALAEAQAVSGVGSWESDFVSGVQLWSDGLYRLIGVDPKEYEPTIESGLAFLHPDDRERVVATFEGSLQAGGYFESEYRIVRPDGEIRAVIARARTFTGRDGEPVRNVGAALDITERKAAEEQLRRREAALAEAQAVSGVGSWETDLVDNVRRWSDELYRIFGVDPEEFEPSFESARELMHPDDLERIDAAFQSSRDSGADFEEEYRIIRPDGETRTVIARARTFTDGDGKPVRMSGAALDITDRKRGRDLLEARQALLITSQELTKVGSFEWDLADDRVTWSEGLYRIFGIEPDGEGAATFEGYLELVPPEDRDERRRRIEQVLETGKPGSDEYRIVRPDGKVRWIESRITALTDEAGKTTRLVGACQDVSERKAGTLQLERDLQAARSRPLRDPLTGLANRTLALDRLDHAFELAAQGETELSVTLIDVDGFKDVNERHGQLLGDSVLVLAAERLRSCTRESDTVARVGADEFLVLCEGVEAPSGMVPTSESLPKAFASPLELERRGETIDITFSIGSSSIGDRSVLRPRQLLEEAEEALTWARGRGPGGYAQHPGDPAKTNGHRAGPSVARLNADPSQTSRSPAERSTTEELVRRMYEVWSSGECDEWVSNFHEEVEYVPSSGLSGFDPIYRGHEGMRRFWAHKQQGWESTEIMPLSFEQRGDHFVVFVISSLVLRVTGAQVEVSLHQGGTMRDGLIHRLGGYESRTEAFEALGAADASP
jgi:diguanylate cyclase (GGDEF)-like protein/PAS domain S-box-containing protein